MAADGNSPLNMGAPWDAISGLGGPPSQGPAFGQELSRAFAPQQGPAPQRLPGQEELNNALANMRDFQARLVTTQQAAAVPRPPEKMTIDTDPTTGKKSVTVKTSAENFQATTDSAMKYHEMLGGYAKQLDQIQGRLAAQEQNLRNQPPWVQLATALSANLANQPGMPGWVRGLGQTAAQLNPRPDQIAMQRAGLLQEQAGIAEKGAALDIAQLKALMEGGKIATEQDLKQRKEVDQVGQKLAQGIRLLTKTGAPLTEEAVRGLREISDPNHLLSEEQVKSAITAASGMAEAAGAGLEAAQGRKKDLLQTTSDLALQRGVALSQLGAGQKASIMREAFALNHGQDALNFERAKKEVSMGIAMKLAQAKSTGVISPSDSQKLQGGLSTNTYLASIGDMLKKPEIATLAEPFFVVDRGKDGSVEGVRINPEATLPKSWQSLSKVEADNMIKHEIPRLLNLLFKQGVGAQMFRSKEGTRILNDLGISNNMRVDQMQAILKTIRETNNTANFQPVAVTKPGVDWSNPENAAMLALDDPENADFWSGVGRFGGKIPVKTPGKATAPALSKAGYDAWLKTQGNK